MKIKKYLKKILCLSLVAIIALFAVGCGNNSSKDKNDGGNSSSKLSTKNTTDDVVDISKYGYTDNPDGKTLTIHSNGISESEEKANILDIPSEIDGKTVTEIEENGFYFCKNIEEVIIPNTVEKIGENAFLGCRSLKSVTIPASVTSIGEKAFGYYTTEKNEYKKYDGFTIYGYSGTAAETYAEENGFTFIPLEDNVTGVTYTPTWSSVNDYGFTVSGRADKLQVIEANGGTRTVTRNSSNVVIKSYDINGNEVSSLSRELDYEVWTVNTRLTPDTELQVHAKYNNEWVDATYRFSVSTLYSDKTLKKAELSSTSGGQGMVDCNIVTGSGVSKVRVEYEDGMTSTYNSGYATLDVENMTYTYDISVKAYRTGEIPYKIYIKTPSGWQYATTLTYTAE